MLSIGQIESFYPVGLRPFKRNLIREYLQYKILESIFNSEYGGSLVFMGGTAAHIIYGNTRFSEDLNFDNIGLSRKGFETLAGTIKKKLELEGYTADLKNTFKGAYSSQIRLPGLLYENKLSLHKEESIMIKIDAEPQNFKYSPDKVILNKFDVFVRINAVSQDLLLAQKILAIFKRKRPIGRDFYDAIFLMGKTGPDFKYLKAKLDIDSEALLRQRLIERCQKLDFTQLTKDVEQFVYNADDARKILLFYEYWKNAG